MAGLNHDFLLLSTREHRYKDYLELINHPQAIHLHDDLLRYMHDTLAWITSYLPAKKLRRHKGLNFYGPTVIKQDGAVEAQKLFTTWAALFSAGPKQIKLTGPYEWIYGESQETGKYSTIKINRDEVVETLKTLAKYAKKVAHSNGELFILHLGI